LAIGRAPIAILVGSFIVGYYLSDRVQGEHPTTGPKPLGFLVSVPCGIIGFILMLIWRYEVVPHFPTKWPEDYISLAKTFLDGTQSKLLVITAYSPIILTILKLLKLDVVSGIAESLLKRE
jgi:MFS family permease